MSHDIETMLREAALELRPGPTAAAPSELRRRAERRRAVRRGGTIVAVLAVVAGVALGVGGLNSHAPTPPAEQTAWTRAEACANWRSVTAPEGTTWTAMRAARDRQLAGAASWQTVRDAAGRYGDASRKLAEQLLSPRQPWPSPLDRAASPSASFNIAEATWAERVARSNSEVDLNTAWDQDHPMSGALPVSYTDAATLVTQACPG